MPPLRFALWILVFSSSCHGGGETMFRVADALEEEAADTLRWLSRPQQATNTHGALSWTSPELDQGPRPLRGAPSQIADNQAGDGSKDQLGIALDQQLATSSEGSDTRPFLDPRSDVGSPIPTRRDKPALLDLTFAHNSAGRIQPVMHTGPILPSDSAPVQSISSEVHASEHDGANSEDLGRSMANTYPSDPTRALLRTNDMLSTRGASRSPSLPAWLSGVAEKPSTHLPVMRDFDLNLPASPGAMSQEQVEEVHNPAPIHREVQSSSRSPPNVVNTYELGPSPDSEPFPHNTGLPKHIRSLQRTAPDAPMLSGTRAHHHSSELIKEKSGLSDPMELESSATGVGKEHVPYEPMPLVSPRRSQQVVENDAIHAPFLTLEDWISLEKEARQGGPLALSPDHPMMSPSVSQPRQLTPPLINEAHEPNVLRASTPGEASSAIKSVGSPARLSEDSGHTKSMSAEFLDSAGKHARARSPHKRLKLDNERFRWAPWKSPEIVQSQLKTDVEMIQYDSDHHGMWQSKDQDRFKEKTDRSMNWESEPINSKPSPAAVDKMVILTDDGHQEFNRADSHLEGSGSDLETMQKLWGRKGSEKSKRRKYGLLSEIMTSEERLWGSTKTRTATLPKKKPISSEFQIHPLFIEKLPLPEESLISEEDRLRYSLGTGSYLKSEHSLYSKQFFDRLVAGGVYDRELYAENPIFGFVELLQPELKGESQELVIHQSKLSHFFQKSLAGFATRLLKPGEDGRRKVAAIQIKPYRNHGKVFSDEEFLTSLTSELPQKHHEEFQAFIQSQTLGMLPKTRVVMTDTLTRIRYGYLAYVKMINSVLLDDEQTYDRARLLEQQVQASAFFNEFWRHFPFQDKKIKNRKFKNDFYVHLLSEDGWDQDEALIRSIKGNFRIIEDNQLEGVRFSNVWLLLRAFLAKNRTDILSAVLTQNGNFRKSFKPFFNKLFEYSCEYMMQVKKVSSS